MIDHTNIEATLGKLALEELCGIKSGYGGRLRAYGINSAIAFYRAPSKLLQRAFHSVTGHHWWMRLHGWEADDREFARKSFGQSYALYKSYSPTDSRLAQILCQLVEKMGKRMRNHGFAAAGIHVSCLFADHTYWHKGKKLPAAIYSGGDLYREARAVLTTAPDTAVKILAVSCHYLQEFVYEQGELFRDNARTRELVRAIDTVQNRWGDFTVFPARMLGMEHKVLDRIAFGGMKDLEEFAFQDTITSEREG